MGYKKNMAKNLFPHVPGWEWDKVAQKKQWKKLFIILKRISQ